MGIRPPFGLWPVAATGLAFVVSFVFWGIGPAGYLSTRTQDLLANAGFAVVVGLVLRRCWSPQKQFQFRLRSLFVLSFVCAVLIQVVLYFRIGFPAAVHAEPNRLLEGVAKASASDPAAWLPGPTWIQNSVIQWLMQEGAAIAIGLTAALILLRGFLACEMRQAFINGAAVTAIAALLCLGVWPWTFPAYWKSIAQRNAEIENYLFMPDEYYANLDSAFTDLLRTNTTQSTYLGSAKAALLTHQEISREEVATE